MPQGRSKNSAYQRSRLSSTICMDVTIYPVLVFVLSFFSLAFSAWIGVLFSRNRGVEAEMREDFGIILAATLTLLGLIVGFTFSMALGRYDQRKNYEEEEANAIGTELLDVELVSKWRQKTGLLSAADRIGPKSNIQIGCFLLCTYEGKEYIVTLKDSEKNRRSILNKKNTLADTREADL